MGIKNSISNVAFFPEKSKSALPFVCQVTPFVASIPPFVPARILIKVGNHNFVLLIA